MAFPKVGRRFVGKVLCIDYLFSATESPRLGITASSRYGDAVERNRFKRLVREVFRKNSALLPSFLGLHVTPRQRAKGAKEDHIREELLALIQKIPAIHAQSESR